MKFYKYQGAGNDFLIADNREGSIVLTAEQISALCDRRYGVGADGLMLLEEAYNTPYDSPQSRDALGFRMVYYNSDGSGGMMCGNGGRCIIAFASDIGIRNFSFDAPDGHHIGKIVSSEGVGKIVTLKMKNVQTCSYHRSLRGVSVPSDGYFLDTGTRHYVRMVHDLSEYDVTGEGRDIRYNAEELQPAGVNINFVESCGGFLKVRTYEKGVEDETFACGTGIVASCIAAYMEGIEPSEVSGNDVMYDVVARRDNLSVRFRPSDILKGIAEEVWLTGPATFVAEVDIPVL